MSPLPRTLTGLVTALLVLLSPAAHARAPTPTGRAVWPLDPQPAVVSVFDLPSSRWGAGHRGADLAGSVGQRVRAALPGTISFAGRIAGRGVVVVDHGSTRTTYEPVEATVGRGDTVAAGDPIGTLELGGSHCFPAACLHWGLRAGEDYRDPLTLVGAGPVRLLPLGPSSSTSLTVLRSGAPGGPFPRWAVPTPQPVRPAGNGALFRGR